MAPIVTAATATAAALELVDLFVEAIQFLLGELAFAFGFLEGREDPVEVAHDGLEAVADAIDLAAQDAIGISIAIVSPPSAVPVPAAVAVSVASAAIVTAVASTTFAAVARSVAIIAPGRFAVSVGAAFVKFVGLVMFVGGRFGNTFALGRFIDRGRNIFVFVTRAVFAFGFALTIIIVFRRT